MITHDIEKARALLLQAIKLEDQFTLENRTNFLRASREKMLKYIFLPLNITENDYWNTTNPRDQRPDT